MPELNEGLAGVVVAESRISKVFGEEGRLVYRGFDIDDLAEHARFEETAHLLWHRELPDEKELEAFTQDLASKRRLPDHVRELVTGPLVDAHPMAALRTGVSALADSGREPAATPEGALAAGLDILATMPSIVAAHARAREGKDPIEPDENLGHAAAFLHQITGEHPDEDAARAMDLALTLHADHGFNASTFSARVTASTLSDAYSSITSAIGALKGDLHGGANANVMRLLEEIDEADTEPEYRSTLGSRPSSSRMKGSISASMSYQRVSPSSTRTTSSSARAADTSATSTGPGSRSTNAERANAGPRAAGANFGQACSLTGPGNTGESKWRGRNRGGPGRAWNPRLAP